MCQSTNTNSMLVLALGFYSTLKYFTSTLKTSTGLLSKINFPTSIVGYLIRCCYIDGQFRKK